MNPALVAFAGTHTLLGRVTAGLLLDRFILSPLLGAPADSSTVHTSVPDPVIVPLLQESALSVADEPVPAVPAPLRVITDESVVAELLAMPI
jgi:hypothetical protein